MANRLASATSPYLLQHADNPVDWWEWGPEAFAVAQQQDLPILLSVGYAACHWCHVMAHESFENPEIAAIMNAGFISIKVDREERPDIDAVYMAATQALTGQGGWPMTVFLTPAGEPFYAGTYFPPTPRHGIASFPQVLGAISQAWNHRRDTVFAAAGQITDAIKQMSQALPSTSIGDAELSAAVESILSSFDPVRGGFGGAPKFPPAMTIQFLSRYFERTGDQRVGDAITKTLDAMGRGGIYDQLAGGFARYSVDADWVVPHFEKMLYDNALLLRAYADQVRLTGSEFARRICVETVEFLESELLVAGGGFASSLDADTDGVEGLTSVWTRDQLTDALGTADGIWVAKLLQVTEQGTFEASTSVLQLLDDPDDLDRWARLRAQLLGIRNQRPQPARDDKVIASWNGLLIGALAQAGAVLERPDWWELAESAARYLVDRHLKEGRLFRSSKDGRLGAAAGVLSDYADLAHGLLELYQVRADRQWLDTAGDLLESAVSRFADGAGGYFDTADDGEKLVVRPRDPTDGATPSGASALAEAMLTYGALTGEPEWRERAEAALTSAGAVLRQHPRSAGRWLAVAEAIRQGPLQVAVVGSSGPEREALALAARLHAPGGSVVVVGEPDDQRHPLLAHRTLIALNPTAYVCRGFVCDRPVDSAPELIDTLASTKG